MTRRLLLNLLLAALLLSAVAAMIVIDLRPPAAKAPASRAAEPTVASITPAGTDLLIGIGAANHLVAVSDLDEDRDGVSGLPRVGDFDHVDWEKLAAASPKILLTQFGDRMPAGLTDRCAQLGIRLIDIQLNVTDDVYRQAHILGAAMGIADAADEKVKDLKHKLADVRDRMVTAPRVRTAIAVFDGGSVGLIGPGTFHDQLLATAGGVNVAARMNKPYVVADREQLMSLAPEVVLDLEPVPPTTPQQLDAAKAFWDSLPDLPAVKNGQVRTITVPYCLRPGWHLADLADVFAKNLH
jgi:iron complex transport system substrate-binding protein